MAKNRKDQGVTGELVPFQPAAEVQVLPPDSAITGQFFAGHAKHVQGPFNEDEIIAVED